MSNIIRKAVQGREDRVAVDSLLSFQASKQHYVDCGVQQALMAAIDHDKSFSMSFFLAPLVTETATRTVISISKNINNTGHYSGIQLNMNYSLSRNAYRIFFYFFQKTDAAYSYKSWVTDYIFRANALHHIVYNYTAATGLEIYVNGKKETVTLNLDYGTITGSIYTVPDITTAFGAKVTDGVSENWPDMLFNHLSVFNRTLTEAEIQGIHHLGGVLPSSIHAACVAHYPLQANYSRTVLDVVEQYNYAKNLTAKDFTGVQWDFVADGNQEFHIVTNLGYGGITASTMHFSATVPTYLKVEILEAFVNDLEYGEDQYLGAGTLQLIPKAVGIYEFYIYSPVKQGYGTARINVSSTTGRIRVLAHKQVFEARYGTLINYTDRELGLVNQSTQTAYKDFYRKANKLDKLLMLEKSKQQYGSGLNNNVAQAITNQGDFAISFFAAFTEVPTTSGGKSYVLYQGKMDSTNSNRWIVLLQNQSNIAGEVLIAFVFAHNNPINSNDGTTNFFFSVPIEQLKRLNHYVFNFSYSTNTVSLKINTVDQASYLVYTQLYNAATTSQTSEPLYIAEGTFTSKELKSFNVNHIVFFNRTLTATEIQDTFQSDGIPPASTYAAIIAHYEPDTAALKITDLVEQYNGSKGASPLTAQHGSLVNYTGTETRLLEQKSLLPSLQNALQFNGADGGQYVRALNVPLAGTSFTIVIAFKTPGRFRDDYKDALCTVLDSANAPILAIYGLDVNLYGMNVGAKDCIAVWSGNSNVLESHNITYGEWQLMALRVPESFASADLYQNGHALSCARATTWAGFSGNNTVEIGADSRLSNRRFKGGIGFFGITQQVLTEKQLLEIANNALGKQPQKRWNIDWKVLPNFNRIIDNTANVAGQYLLEDLSGKNHTIEAVNYTSAQINAEDTARTALKPINYLQKDFYHLVRKGMYSDGVNQRLSTTDSLSLGDGTQSFSMRYWAAIARKTDNSHFLENNVTDPRISIAHRIVSNDTFLLLYFGVSGRLGAIEVMYDDYTLKYDNKLNYYGVDRITNNSANWIAISADQRIIPTAGQVTYNSLVETDVLAMANPHFFAGLNWGTQYNVKGTTTGFMLFQPALTEAQNNWLYNKGKGNDPTGMEAKAMGIGIAGIDTIGANGITTLLTRYMTFEKLYTSTNEYIREHVTNNNTYAQLYNYDATDAKIVHLP